MLTLLQDKIDTPLGPLWVICDEQFNLRAVEWDQHRDRMEQLLDVHYRREGYQRVDSRNPGNLSRKLSDYFAGDLAIIDTLPTATGGTPFQREVWQTLRTIPCGQVMHYVSSRRRWDVRARRAPWVPPTVQILSVLWCPATG